MSDFVRRCRLMPVGEFAIMLLREKKKGRMWDSTCKVGINGE